MFELFHEGYFADRGTGSTFFAIKVDFFESDKLARLAVTSFEDLGVCISAFVQWQNDSLTVAYVPSPSYGTRQCVASTD